MTESTGSTGAGVRRAVALAIAVLSAGCSGGGGGSGDGGGGFTAASPVANVCGLLTLADVQAVMPGAVAGVEQPTADTTSVGFWSRDCKWEDAVVTSRLMELVIFGATTAQGLAGLKLAAASGDTNTPVSGLGTEAHYWVKDPPIATNGLWARDGSLSVDVTAYFFDPIPTEAQLHPLVAKVLGELK
jgi:hypothetical protein